MNVKFYQAIRLILKHAILFFFINILFITKSIGQKIYSDDELLTSAVNAFKIDDYVDAQVYFFAYIQRNPNLYQTDTEFKLEVDSSLDFSTYQVGLLQPKQQSTNTASTAGVSGTSGGKGKGPSARPKLPLALEHNVQLFSKIQLTSGKYHCNDGGTYYVTVINDEVWWFGESPNGSWSNVMHGLYWNGKIQGTWSDVPLGEIHNSGKISLQILNANSFKMITQSGNFGGSIWNKIEDETTPQSGKKPTKID